jgi:hypothetical protein
MTAAVFSPTLSNDAQAPSKLAQVIGRAINALVESRAKSASRELRRHEAFIADLGRRQDHSSLFLEQSDLLPFKV